MIMRHWMRGLAMMSPRQWPGFTAWIWRARTAEARRARSGRTSTAAGTGTFPTRGIGGAGGRGSSRRNQWRTTMSSDKRPPDYNVSAVMRGTEIKGGVGVAWKDEETGRISVKLSTFVVLTASPDLFVTLFPRDTTGTVSRQSRKSERGSGGEDDDIPF